MSYSRYGSNVVHTSRRKSTGTKSENRKGSKPAFPTYPSQFGGASRKGSEVDFAANEVVERAEIVKMLEMLSLDNKDLRRLSDSPGACLALYLLSTLC